MATTASARMISTTQGTRLGSFGPAEWGLVSFLGLTWGASFLFIDIGLDEFSPYLITWLRALFGAIALGFVPSARERVDSGNLPRIVLLGFIWIAIPFTFFPVAQQWINSSLAGMLNATLPLFAAAIAAILLRSLPGRIHAAGLMVGFLGVLLISIPSWGEGENAGWGILLVVAATLFYGLSVNIAVPLQQAHGALPVVWRALVVAALATMPLGVYGATDSSFGVAALSAVTALGVAGTGIALAVMATLVGRVGATRGGVAIYFIPVVAVILGVVFRDDRIQVLALAGMVLVLVGAYLASRKEQAL